MKRKQINVGDKFGKLTVLRKILEKSPQSSRNTYHKLYQCVCDCCNSVIVPHKMLSSGHKRSCGCLRAEIERNKSIIYNIKHKELLYVWKTMKQRCLCKTNKDYRLYGGRGITVCNEWLNDFYSFNDWAEKNGYKKGLMLDRINNDGNYEPSNCRWATPTEQANNKRTNKWITINNETKTLKQWCDKLNLSYSTTNSRLQRGWSVDEAFNIIPYNPPKRILKSRRKRVLQFSLDCDFIKEWESMYDAAEYLNCNPRYIKKTCLGEQKSYFGYIWKYKTQHDR
jgi:hypothetical protein